MTWWQDIFGGNGGQQSQGAATVNGAGDGDKGTQIRNWLSRVTGAYDQITGAGRGGSPAPAPQAVKPAKPTWLYVAGGLLVIGLLYFLLKKR